MKLTCEYCGSVFETADHPVCPQCGSEYGENPAFRARAQDEAEFLEERRRLLLERQRINNEAAKKKARQDDAWVRDARSRRLGCLIPVVIFGSILLIGSILVALKNPDLIDTTTDRAAAVEETETLAPMEAVSGTVGETIETPQYAVRVPEIRLTDGYPWDCPAGHSFVLIHVLLENRTGEYLEIPDNVHVIADGIAQKQYYTPSSYRRLENWLDKGLTTEGWFQFDVPDDAAEMELTFGDYVTCRFTWDDITRPETTEN